MHRKDRTDTLMTTFDVTLSDIEAARSRIAGRVRRTPAFESAEISARLGRRTAVKMEALQLAGSFKVRGVFNAALGLSEAERRRQRLRDRPEVGDAIGIEQPSYYYSLPLFQAVGARLIPLAVDQLGVQPEAIGAAFGWTSGGSPARTGPTVIAELLP